MSIALWNTLCFSQRAVAWVANHPPHAAPPTKIREKARRWNVIYPRSPVSLFLAVPGTLPWWCLNPRELNPHTPPAPVHPWNQMHSGSLRWKVCGLFFIIIYCLSDPNAFNTWPERIPLPFCPFDWAWWQASSGKDDGGTLQEKEASGSFGQGLGFRLGKTPSEDGPSHPSAVLQHLVIAFPWPSPPHMAAHSPLSRESHSVDSACAHHWPLAGGIPARAAEITVNTAGAGLQTSSWRAKPLNISASRWAEHSFPSKVSIPPRVVVLQLLSLSPSVPPRIFFNCFHHG